MGSYNLIKEYSLIKARLIQHLQVTKFIYVTCSNQLKEYSWTVKLYICI